MEFTFLRITVPLFRFTASLTLVSEMARCWARRGIRESRQRRIITRLSITHRYIGIIIPSTLLEYALSPPRLPLAASINHRRRRKDRAGNG